MTPPPPVPSRPDVPATGPRRGARAVLGLLLSTLFVACGSGTGTTGSGSSPSDELAAKYPYLPGVDYSWTDTRTTPTASLPWVGPTMRVQGGPDRHVPV